jgi:hypothetical protein
MSRGYSQWVTEWAPALGVFGPIIMMMGVPRNTLLDVGWLISYLGAFMLALGSSGAFMLIREQTKELKRLRAMHEGTIDKA